MTLSSKTVIAICFTDEQIETQRQSLIQSFTAGM
jgi:hypothetical protein